MSAHFEAVGTANIGRVDVEPLTSADLVRQLNKEIRDVYGSRRRFSDAMGEPDNTVGRYLRGEREMPADFLLRAIVMLEQTPERFFSNARETRTVRPKGD